MSDSSNLVPLAVEGTAVRAKRFGVAFGRRFFILLIMGVAWLGPALIEPRFVYAMFAWDVLAIIAWVIDLGSLPRPSRLKVRRAWQAPLRYR